MNNKLIERIDCKGHVVLGKFGMDTVLFCPEDVMQPFVCAYGYNPETGEWKSGKYSNNPGTVWNIANPDIVSKLSPTITWNYLREMFEEAEYAPTKEQLDDFVDSVEASLWHESYYYTGSSMQDGITQWLFADYAEEHDFLRIDDTCANCLKFNLCPSCGEHGYCTESGEWQVCTDKPCYGFERI